MKLFNTEAWINLLRIIIVLFICQSNFKINFTSKKDKFFHINNTSKLNYSNQLKEKILYLVEKNLAQKRHYSNILKLKKIHTIAAIDKLMYGNAIAELNNLIFICEIIKCNKVIVPKTI